MDRRSLITLIAVFLLWRFLTDAQRYVSLIDAAVLFVGNIVVFLVAITLHEFGHAAVATWLGDSTARAQGRLSLNPLRHLDPIGTLLILSVQFGFAKPVPVNPARFRHPRRDQVLVALAGPLMNLLLCALCLAALRFASALPVLAIPGAAGVAGDLLRLFLAIGAVMNAILAVFNLIPIPPLDGSHLLESVLDPRQRTWYYQNQTMLSLVGLVLLLGGFLEPFFRLVSQFVLRLAGA
ncbi:MAG: site-2 protease family protein [Candidatus Riflebacteria bacterium]|nr:site-2 protease family protein [Candidatus Riflebacteria bacterium]